MFNDYVDVPVHTSQLPEVFALLHRLNPLNPPDGSTVPPSGDAIPVMLNEVWDEAKLVELHRRLKPIARAFLTRMAEAGTLGQSIFHEDLRQVGGFPMEQIHRIAGNLSWISKHSIALTGRKDGLYPKPTNHGPKVSIGRRYEYRMWKVIADAWLRIVNPVT